MISRRTVLKAAGVSLALPAFGFEKENRKAPVRSFFIGMGYGVTWDKWFPVETHNNYKMTEGLKPLERYRKDFSVIQNLTEKNHSGPHDSSIHFLRGKELRSCDQVLAEKIGKYTRFQSLELNCADKSTNGHGKIFSMASDFQGKSMPGVMGPTELYFMLFSSGKRDLTILRKNLADRKSLLDALTHDIKSLDRKLDKADREVLEEYCSSIRTLEKKIERTEKWLDKPLLKPSIKPPATEISTTESVKITYEMLALAFQADMTRVASYIHPISGILDDIGFTLGPHGMSHYKGDESKKMGSLKRDIRNSELFAHLIKTFKATKDIDGKSLLDNSMIVFGSSCRTGHGMRNGPLLFAGQGGGKVKQGQNIIYKPDETPAANLWYSMLKSTDSEVSQFADSNSFMSELFKS